MAHMKMSATIATPIKLHINPIKYIIILTGWAIFDSSISGSIMPSWHDGYNWEAVRFDIFDIFSLFAAVAPIEDEKK